MGRKTHGTLCAYQTECIMHTIRPEQAIVLFNGNDLNNWRTREGGAAGWIVEDGIMTVEKGTGDIVTQETFRDFQLHIEFRIPDMPDATGQAKGNSGVYIQGRYEIQVLDSYGLHIPGQGDCGGVYDMHAPLLNACKPAMEWQSYDIVFRAPRFDQAGREIHDHARITLIQNGMVVQNNVQVTGPTGGAIDHNVDDPGPLLLQDHGDLVSYRNIWVMELPLVGSDTYESR